MRRAAPRIVLTFAAIVFGIVALPGLFAPQYLANSVGLSNTGAAGANEFRAVFGGLIGGITVFFAVASVRPAWYFPALVAQACVFVGMVTARAASIASAGNAGSAVYFMLAVEAFGAVAAVVALRGLSGRSVA